MPDLKGTRPALSVLWHTTRLSATYLLKQCNVLQIWEYSDPMLQAGTIIAHAMLNTTFCAAGQGGPNFLVFILHLVAALALVTAWARTWQCWSCDLCWQPSSAASGWITAVSFHGELYEYCLMFTCCYMQPIRRQQWCFVLRVDHRNASAPSL